MSRDLREYRASSREQERIRSIVEMLPAKGTKLLDIGARDGYLSRILVDRFESVVALDLEKPQIEHPRIFAVQGDATNLEFADGAFQAVLCAEVLEHVPSPSLAVVCKEIVRVCASAVVIGVPFRQDLRFGRTTCATCGKANPPWGHVNAFDLDGLDALFEGLTRTQTAFVGLTRAATNGLSAALLDYAGNPFGTYEQEEPCVYCGAILRPPRNRSVSQRLATRIAHWIVRAQACVARPHANWIHVRYERIRRP